MASSPSPERPAHLKVTAGSPLAELFLVDHDFALVNRGIGELDCTVESGVYKLKAKLGDAIAERLVVLEGDDEIDLSAELDVSSAAPLTGAARTRDAEDIDAARIESARVDPHDGHAARIFLMSRGWDDEPSPAAAPKLTLHRPDGTLVADASSSEARGGGMAMTVGVDPGPYFLRWEDGCGLPAEQCIHAVEGWQTQLFVLDEPDDEAALGRARVSIHMGRDGFDPAEDQLHIAEQARTALADERRIAADFINEALPERLTNPMLGLFGAHLMLIARNAQLEAEEERARRDTDRLLAPVQFEQKRFDAVVDALGGFLGGDHPDVVALATQASGAVIEALAPVSAPPMLWRSWVLLIEASNLAPALVPVSVWRRTLRLLPLRPFLLWSYEEDQEVADDWTEGIAQALATAKREPKQQPGGAGPVSNVISAAQSEVSEAGGEGIAASDETRRRVSRELLAPRSAVDEVASPRES